jgi:hypothetical protein
MRRSEGLGGSIDTRPTYSLTKTLDFLAKCVMMSLPVAGDCGFELELALNAVVLGFDFSKKRG